MSSKQSSQFFTEEEEAMLVTGPEGMSIPPSVEAQRHDQFESGKTKKIKEDLNQEKIVYANPLKEKGQDALQIGDLIFAMPLSLSPPTVIRVDKQHINFKWQALRTEAASKAPSGRANSRVAMSLYFVGMNDINNGLRRLIATFNAAPFVYVENSFLRANLAPGYPDGKGSSDNMAFSLVGFSLRTEPQLPTTLVVDLDLLWFNYKPYAPHFWFRANWKNPLTETASAQSQTMSASTRQTEGVKIPSKDEADLVGLVDKKDPLVAYSAPEKNPIRAQPFQDMVTSRMGPVIDRLENKLVLQYREYTAIDGLVPNRGADRLSMFSWLLRSVETANMAPQPEVKMKLMPDAADALEVLAADFRRERGKKLPIGSCFRSFEWQTDRYETDLRAKREYEEKHPGKYGMTVAKNSWHEVGLAVDLQLPGLHISDWEWLVRKSTENNASGWKALGEKYKPYVNNSGIIIRRPKGASRDTKGRFQNWETWHFDYKPLQKKYKQKYGGTAPLAIQSLRSILNHGDISDENPNNKRLEKLKAEDKKYRESIQTRLSKLKGDDWVVDEAASNVSRLFLYRNHTFTIENDDKELVPQGITITKHNIIAEIPIMSHQFATHQYLGSSDMEAIVTCVALDESKLQELQAISDLLQRNARAFRKVQEGAVIGINNSVFKLMRFDKALIEGISAQSIEGSPGLYTVRIQLTQYTTKESKLHQEKFIPAYLWKELAKHVTGLMSIGDDQVKGFLLARNRRTESRTVPAGSWGGETTTYQKTLVNSFDDNLVQQALWFFYPEPIRKQISDWRFKTTSGLQQGFFAFLLTEPNGDFEFNDTKLAQFLRSYATIMGEVIEDMLHPTLMGQLGLGDKADVIKRRSNKPLKILGITIPAKVLGSVPAKADIDRAEGLKETLRSLANDLMSSSIVLHDPLFAEFTEKYKPQLEAMERGSECYPDLHLPEHPVTGNRLDTPPDYWFYNESVEGAMLLSSGKSDLLKKISGRAENTYESANRVGGCTYAEEKLIPSINKIDFANDEKRLGAAFSPPEDGLAFEKDFNINMDKIKLAANIRGKVEGYSKNKFSDKQDFAEFGAKQDSLVNEPDNKGVKDDTETILNGSSARFVSILKSNFNNFDEEVYRLARAYPTFKIYFIEEDTNDFSYGRRNFDDFYSYSAIKDIRIVRSRKIPADLCVISIINTSGELDNIIYGSGDDKESSAHIVEKYNPLTVDTKQENPFSKLVIMEGSKIQVRLGFSNDADELETVFNGQVVEVGVSEISPDIIQIVCQSYAVELVAEEKNADESFDNTQELLSSMICSPELTHFGRWGRKESYDVKEIRTALGKLTDEEHYPTFLGISTKYRWLQKRILGTFEFYNKPQDDNVFAPGKETYTTSWGQSFVDWTQFFGGRTVADALGVWETDREYFPKHVTIWEIFKEMELRHPGYIALPVPYGNRMTMFFGPPDHRYWSSPMTRTAHERTQSYWETARRITSPLVQLWSKDITSQDMQRLREDYKTMLKERQRRYRPFRNYFFLSSQHNIIANNISASAHGTFNAINLHHMKNKSPLDFGETGGESTWFGGLKVVTGMDFADVFTMKADDNIEDKDTRVLTVGYSSCFGTFFARRYAVMRLIRSLKDTYKGTIVITGNPKIKPFDTLYIYDDYRDMYGPVEVEQVTHIFSRDTGFITEIKPDMVIHHNSWTTQSTCDAMWALCNEYFGATASVGAVLGTFALTGTVGLGIALLGGYKLASWTQARQPLIVTPLTLGFKPLLAGLHGYKNENFFVSIEGKWERWWDDAKTGWNTFWDHSLPETVVGLFQPNI